MADETVCNVLTKREDGTWEVRDGAGEVVGLCSKRPGALFFVWQLFLEARAQTALLKKIEAAMDGIARVVENQPPDYTAQLNDIAELLGELKVKGGSRK